MFGRNEGPSEPQDPRTGQAAGPQQVVATPEMIDAMLRLLRINYTNSDGVHCTKTVECHSTMLSGTGALMIQKINFVLGDPVQQCIESFADGVWQHFEDVTPAPAEPSRIIS